MAEQQVKVPDIGDAKDVDVVEILVSPGDRVEKEDSLIVLESDKASMEIPAPMSGVVKAISISVGDKVSEGSDILVMDAEAAGEADSGDAKAEDAKVAPQDAPKNAEAKPPEKVDEAEEAPAPKAKASGSTTRTIPPPAQPSSKPPPREEKTSDMPHATPSVRKLARELGVDLHDVTPSGAHDRILKEDVQAHVKQALSSGGSGPRMAPAPQIDFSQFGPVQEEPLTKIQKLTGQNMHRSWSTIPHVTQFDQADITELEAFRKELRAEYKDVKLTLVAFLLKGMARVLQDMPRFNSSLDPSGEKLIMKGYVHLGVAVDTDAGLVVPVVRDVDKKGIVQLAEELTDISERARNRRLTPKDLQGASMSLSSLGGIGGTAFTPIINPPEVAILGVSRASMQPVYQDGQFVPRLMLPLSLSYDHRVIDGALAARFTVALGKVLGDLRRALL